MNNRHIHPGEQELTNQVARYARAAWTAYDQYATGKLDIDTAYSRIWNLHYDAYGTYSLLRHSPEHVNEARTHL